jgi:hypothetical protein
MYRHGGGSMATLENQLIAAGVNNLKEFGYPFCDAENILSDAIYSQFFVGMLEGNKGMSPSIDAAIDALLEKIGRATHE